MIRDYMVQYLHGWQPSVIALSRFDTSHKSTEELVISSTLERRSIFHGYFATHQQNYTASHTTRP